MTRAARLVLAGCIAALLAQTPGLHAAEAVPTEQDRATNARAVALSEQLRCLVCQGQSIADSDAEIAGDMRDLVRRRIAAGERPAAVRSWLVQRYGNWVSYRPPTQPVGWPLWAAPILLILAGVWIARGRLRRRAAK